MSDGLVYCSVPMFMGASGTCRWSKKNLTYSVTSSLAGLSDEAWLQAIKTAWSYLESVCDIHAAYTEDAANADVIISTGSIDGPSGVLAWSEMPCSAVDQQLRERYDTGEKQWVDSEHPGPGQLDITRVCCHELCHVLGVPHFPAGSPALMAPMYSTSIRKPQPMDIAELQDRYGPPVTVPAPPLPPPLPPVVPPVTPVPNPGGPMTLQLLIQLLLAFLNAFAGSTPPTPPVPGQPVPAGTFLDLLRRLLGKFAGGAMTAAEVQQVYQALSLGEVTEAQMTAPVQAMRLN